MSKKVFSIILCCFVLSVFCLNAQRIVADIPTIQNDTTQFDSIPVFVFNSDEEKEEPNGHLTAMWKNGTEYTYTWSIYDSTNHSFNEIISEEGEISTINNLNEGGYRVQIADTLGNDTSMYAWVFTNKFWVDIVNEDSEGFLKRSSHSCDYFNIEGKAYYDTLVYYSFSDSTRHYLISEAENVKWEVETDDQDFPGIFTKRIDYSEYAKLAEDAVIYLEVEDKYGAIGWDTVEYKTVQVRAKMKDPDIIYIDKLYQNSPDQSFYNNYYINNQTSAPQAVFFESESSSKVDSLIWRFDDDSIHYNADTVTHTYLFPESYKPVLVVYNKQQGCVDSVEVAEEIVVDKYEFELPNFFVITGNENFVFRSLDVSVTNFDIVIVSRWGQKVHEFKGNIRDWKGWNGKIKGSDRYVKTGVYYYYIYYMTGLDSPQKEANIGRSIRRGFIHVFNELN